MVSGKKNLKAQTYTLVGFEKVEHRGDWKCTSECLKHSDYEMDLGSLEVLYELIVEREKGKGGESPQRFMASSYRTA